MKHVLTVSGGGLRGVIPCMALCALEQQSGKLTREIFTGGMAGASTGALLVSACCSGVPAEKSLNVYLNEGRKIFSPTDNVRRRLNLITHGRMFDVRVLAQVVADTLGPVASKWTINDSPVNILLTATDMNGDAQYFTRDGPTNAGRYGKYSLLQAAVASGAAPTYHDAPMVNGLGYCADGGCSGTADPVYMACVEFFTGPKCYGTIDPTDAKVISLGTGFFRGQMPDPPDNLLENVQWVTSSLVGSSKTIAHECVERHWPGVLQSFNPALPHEIDEAAVGELSVLLEVGKQAAAAMDWKAILGV